MGRTSINIALVTLLFLQGTVGLNIRHESSDQVYPASEAPTYDISQSNSDVGHYRIGVGSGLEANTEDVIQESSQDNVNEIIPDPKFIEILDSLEDLVFDARWTIQTSRDQISNIAHQVSSGINHIVANATVKMQSAVESVQQKLIDTNEIINDNLEKAKECIYNTSIHTINTGYDIANTVALRTMQITSSIHEAIQHNVELAKTSTNRVLDASSNLVDNAAIKTSEITEDIRQTLQTVIDWAKNNSSSPEEVAITENDIDNWIILIEK